MKKYVVELTTEERSQLQTLMSKGLRHQRKHAQMLLKADQGPEGPGCKDAEIAEAFDGHPTTVENLRRRLGRARAGGGLGAWPSWPLSGTQA